MEAVFKTMVAMGGAAWSEQSMSSKKGINSIARKVLVFVMIAVAHLVDRVLGDQHLFRDTTTSFYLVNELLSIIENTGRAGF